MENGLKEDLIHEIADRRVLVLVGTGVSLATTGGDPVAGWSGLLADGIRNCETLRRVPGSEWIADMRSLLESGRVDGLLHVAAQVEELLGGPDGGDFRAWLRATVGRLDVVDPDTIRAIGDLGAPIATTNYDDLLEMALPGGLNPVTWTDVAEVMRLVRGERTGVLHLHGHWRTPRSLVFGRRGYDAVLADPLAQAVQQALTTTRTLLLIGYGAGLEDPNFAKLLSWMARCFGGAEHRHYRLVLDRDRDTAQTLHSPDDRVQVLGYGADHRALVPFLRSLAPASKETEAPWNGGARANAREASVTIDNSQHGGVRFGDRAHISGDVVGGDQIHAVRPSRDGSRKAGWWA